MGHRIELGEIETAANSLPNMKNSCCLYDKDKQKIVLFYETDDYDDITVVDALKNRLQRYMLPNVVHKVDEMPQLKNGKVDRVILSKMM